MSSDEAVELLLSECHKHYADGVYTYVFFEEKGLNKKVNFDVVTSIMIEHELVKVSQGGNRIYILPKGEKVIRAGGWIKYLEQTEIENFKRAELEVKALKGSYWSGVAAYAALGLSFLLLIWSVVYFKWTDEINGWKTKKKPPIKEVPQNLKPLLPKDSTKKTVIYPEKPRMKPAKT